MDNIREDIDKFRHFSGRDTKIPMGYCVDDVLIQKLENAIVMKEWSLVEEVINDLKYRDIYKKEKKD